MTRSALQRILLALLFCGGLINYMDRAVFAVLAPQISKDLGLDAAQLGLAFSFFSFGYTAFCMVGGWASDKFGSRRTLAVSMALWSVFCAATGAVFNLISLLIVRTLFGIGESPWISSANKALVQWFPKERYASAFGIASSGQPLGGVVAGPLIGIIAATVNWRWCFVLVALVGLAWVLCWLLLSSDRPEIHKWLAAHERAVPVRDSVQAETAAASGAEGSMLTAIANRMVLATAACFFAYTYLLYFFLSWFPSYLTQAFHMKLSDMSLASAVPWLLGVIGLISGGFVCDAAVRRMGNALLARKLVLGIGLSIAAVTVMLAGVATTATAAIIYMAIGVGCMYLTGPTYFAIALEAVSARNIGGVGGFMVLVANLGGMVAPAVTGYLVRDTGSFATAFNVAGILVLGGAAVVMLFARAPRISNERFQEA